MFTYDWSDDIRLLAVLPIALAIGFLAMSKITSENPLGLAIVAASASGAVLFGLSHLIAP